MNSKSNIDSESDENYGLWLVGEDRSIYNIYSYSHFTFKSIRSHFQIREINFSQSWITDEYSQSKSGGKSGSKFIFSKDRKFILKTIIKSEKDTLLNVLNNLKDVCDHSRIGKLTI